MKLEYLVATLFIFASVSAQATVTNRIVECEGETIINVDGRIGAQTPFRAIFEIDGDVVNMTEGDSFRFSKSYVLHEEITKEDRPGYHSENGNLFFYIKSGRFEIFKMQVVSGALKTEKTSGQCRPFIQNNVFQ